MGIQGLTKLLKERAPSCFKENKIQNYFGRKIAIDASMSIYQFLISVRQGDGQQLQNSEGEITSHLMGLFYRTVRMVDNGIKPCYVFDGKPPTMKSGELAKRSERRDLAQKNLDEAKETGDTEAIDKFSRRLVKVSKEHNDECKKLLEFMGIPYVDAPCEAEAQCAALARAGKVYAAGSEDMDTLTFNSPMLLRYLTASEAKNLPILEFSLDKALKEMELTLVQFVDLCILMGCDYCDSIKGIGPQKAYTLIQQYKTLEEIVENLDQKKYPLPSNFNFKEARELFLNPHVENADNIELKWQLPKEEELIEFLCINKGFNRERIEKGIEKLKAGVKTATQSRLDTFFKVTSTTITKDKRKTKEDTTKTAKKSKGGKFRR